MNDINKDTNQQNGEMEFCADCGFKYKKSEMLEKRDGKWYCRRCVPWNIG